MLERLTNYSVKHHASGRDFSQLQKLNLYYNWQRRDLLCVRTLLEGIARRNPQQKLLSHDAIMAIGAILDSLKTEYERDRAALIKQRALSRVIEDVIK